MIRKIVLYSLFFITLNQLSAQELDSILSSNMTVKEKGRYLRKLSWDIKESNIDSTIIISKLALNYAEKAKDTVGIIRIRKDLSYYYYWGYSDYHRTKLQLDTLYEQFSHVMTPSDWANYYSRLGDVVYYDDEKVKSIEYYHKALDNKTWDSILVARINHNLGWTYADLGYFDKAIEYGERGVDILIRKKADPSANLHGLVYIYKVAGKYDKAIEKLDQAKEYNQDNKILSYYYYRKADLYKQKGDYEEALKNALLGYEDALANKKEKYTLYNLELVYELMHLLNQYPEAYKYFYSVTGIRS